MLSSETQNFILSQIKSGKKLTRAIQDLRPVCSESTVASILRESKAGKIIRKKKGPPRKIKRNMEKTIIYSLTISKRVTTVRGATKKE